MLIISGTEKQKFLVSIDLVSALDDLAEFGSANDMDSDKNLEYF